MRSTKLTAIDGYAQEFMEKYPRKSFPQLKPFKGAGDFQDWARESYRVAEDWAYDVDTVSDPNKDQDADRLVQNMVKFILYGISPVEEAPEVPAAYWERAQLTAHQRITLAGYRIADMIIAAADRISAQRQYVGR